MVWWYVATQVWGVPWEFPGVEFFSKVEVGKPLPPLHPISTYVACLKACSWLTIINCHVFVQVVLVNTQEMQMQNPRHRKG